MQSQFALLLLIVAVALMGGLLTAPRVTAQVALALVPLEFVYYVLSPFSFMVLAPVAFGLTLWPVVWYIVFTLPGELAERRSEHLHVT